MGGEWVLFGAGVVVTLLAGLASVIGVLIARLWSGQERRVDRAEGKLDREGRSLDGLRVRLDDHSRRIGALETDGKGLAEKVSEINETVTRIDERLQRLLHIEERMHRPTREQAREILRELIAVAK